MERTASAEWVGTLREGKGTMSAPSGVLRDTPYTFSSRFESATGTNPEELIGAAHAGCFSMFLSSRLAAAGMTPERIRTTATVTLEKTDAGQTITRIHLDTRAKAGGDVNKERFQAAVEESKVGCPVSRVLRTEITVSAALE